MAKCQRCGTAYRCDGCTNWKCVRIECDRRLILGVYGANVPPAIADAYARQYGEPLTDGAR